MPLVKHHLNSLWSSSPLRSQFLPGETRKDSVAATLADHDKILRQLNNLHKAQQRMKNTAEKKRRELEFQIGDLCFSQTSTPLTTICGF